MWDAFLLSYGKIESNFTDMLKAKGYLLRLRTATLTFLVSELSALDIYENWFLTFPSQALL